MALLPAARRYVCWISGPPFWARVVDTPVGEPRLPTLAQPVPLPRLREPVRFAMSVLLWQETLIRIEFAMNPPPPLNSEPAFWNVSRRYRKRSLLSRLRKTPPAPVTVESVSSNVVRTPRPIVGAPKYTPPPLDAELLMSRLRSIWVKFAELSAL